MKKLLISAVLLVSLTACHTTGSTAAVTTQDVAVTSAPKGAACLVKNASGSATVASTPGSATVTHTADHADNLLVSCKKDGAKGSASVAHTDGAYPSTVHIVVK